MAGEGGRKKREKKRGRGIKKVREREGEEKERSKCKQTYSFEVLPFSTIILKLRVIGP